MILTEHDGEPVPGLPEELPRGERLLWQGAPDWRVLAVSVFHVRKVALYFGLLMAWRLVSGLSDGESLWTALGATALLAPLGAAALGLLCGLAWLTARTTLYSITGKRLVVRFGIALPMTVNLPFALIESASLRRRADGSGDIPLILKRGQRIAYLHIWPHVRPWHFTRPEPMLRGLREVEGVATILGDALAADAGQAAAGQAAAGTPAQARPARPREAGGLAPAAS